MYVGDKTLLSSVESLMRKTNEMRRASVAPLAPSASSASLKKETDAVVIETATDSRYRLLSLNHKQNQLQSDYTFEQTREVFLLDKTKALSSELTHEGQKLFPELESLQNTSFDRDKLLAEVSSKKERLLYDLKGVQVEVENIYALYSTVSENMGASVSEKLGSLSSTKTEKLDAVHNSRDILTERVRQLTSDDPN